MNYPTIVFCVFVWLVIACGNETKTSNEAEMNNSALREAIVQKFTGAVPFNEYTDSLLFFLYAVHNISADKILLGQSTCVDDVLNTKNPFANHAIKGPFNFGGLAGLPFTGITGLNAFAHHVPDNGTALLFVGPHIGFSQKEGWGKIEREGQNQVTACCGALVAALEKLQKPGAIIKKNPNEPDYQEEVIEQLALRHKYEILDAKEPLITLTKLVYKEAEQRILNLPRDEIRFKHIVLIVAVIINTGRKNPDYIWVDHMSIYDLEKEQYLKIMEK
jgi:Limiting CO2-inducible proteins B/C beta carbonyic anhydrases